MSQLARWPGSATRGPGAVGPSVIVKPAGRDTFFPRVAADSLGTTDRATRYFRQQYLATAMSFNPLAYLRLGEVTGSTAYNGARLATSFAAECLADNPGLLWLFDETSGTSAADATGNGNTGTYAGFTLNQAPLIPADTGHAILNTATGFGNNSVTSTYNPFTAGSIAFEFVVANGTSGNESRLVRSDGPDGVYLGTSSASATLAFQPYGYGTFGSPLLWGSALPNNNVAYHYVLTYDPATGDAELWRNGLSWGVQSFGPGGGWGPNTGNIMFGDNGYQGWVGRADAFAVYPGGLSRARIAQHAAWMINGTYNSATLGGPSLVGDSSDFSVSFAGVGSIDTNIQPFPQMSSLERRTFVVTANRSSNVADDSFFGADVGGSGSSGLYVHTNGDVYWEPGTGFPQIWTAAWPGQNQNVHVALRMNPNNLELFVNGVSQGAKSTPFQWGGSNPNAQIRVATQGTFGGSNSWHGSIDDFLMYDGYLTDAQIAGLASAAGTSTARTRRATDFMVPRNYVTNPSFESNLTGWIDAYGSPPVTMTRVTSTSQVGTASMKVDTDATVTTNRGVGYALSGTFYAGVTYTLGFQAKGAVGSEQIQYVIGGSVGNNSFIGMIPITSSFAQYTLQWTPNVDVSDAIITFKLGSPSSTYFFDAVFVRQGTSTTYLEGDPMDVAIGSTITILTRTGSDTLGTTDAAARIRIALRAAADTLGTADAATRVRVAPRSGADTLGTTDAATRLAVFARAAADVLGTTDAATRIRIAPRSAADALGTVDAATRLLSLARTGSDALGTTDLAARLVARTLLGADTLGTFDVATRTSILARAAADTLGTTDAATRFVVLLRAAADALGTSDLATTRPSRLATDTLGTTDVATRLETMLRTAADALGTTDAATRIRIAGRTATDALGTTDAATRLAIYARLAADVLATSDAAVRGALSRTRTSADTLGTTDAATSLAIRARAAADSLGTTDAASRAAASRLRAAADILGTSDAATRIALLRFRTALDTLGTFDSADGLAIHVTGPDLTEPLGALVISYVAKALAADYVAKALADTPTSKTVTIEPTQKAPTQQESHAKVGVTDYAGKTKVL